MQNVLDTLRERGFIAQITYEDELYKQLEKEPTVFYVGFDPTATSLHFGHFTSHHRHRPICSAPDTSRSLWWAAARL